MGQIQARRKSHPIAHGQQTAAARATQSPEIVTSIPALPRRAGTANKGDCGKVLIIGGSRGMAGAPCLAARAAYRGGAGLVRVAVPFSLWDVAATKLDECLTDGCPETKTGSFSNKSEKKLLELCAWAEVVVLGPGMSQNPETAGLIRKLVRSLTRPLVLDADGLNAFAGEHIGSAGFQPAKNKGRQDACAPRTVVLTPHPGEMGRLLGQSAQEVQAQRTQAVRACVQLTQAVVVLKGAGTLVADGQRLYENKTGNAGMATGGTGDVLSGLIAALLGQGLAAFDAACLGVYLHGLAGDLACQRLGMWSMVAGDLIDELPNAIKAEVRSQKSEVRSQKNRIGNFLS